MRKLKLILKVLSLLFVFGLLHYVLPQHDIVRVTSTKVKEQNLSWINQPFFAQSDSGDVASSKRQISFINSEKRKTLLFGFIPRDAYGVMVYRNEDTGWIWPPYFKFDTSNLQAEADAVSLLSGGDQWVVITHYGWRSYYLSIYPNAIGIRKVSGPDVRIIPWFNLFFFTFMIVAYFFLRAMWRQFRERSVDPLLQDASEAWDKVDGHADVAGAKARGVFGRFTAWLATWRKK